VGLLLDASLRWLHGGNQFPRGPPFCSATDGTSHCSRGTSSAPRRHLPADPHRPERTRLGSDPSLANMSPYVATAGCCEQVRLRDGDRCAMGLQDTAGV